MDDIIVRLIDLGSNKVKGVVVTDSDGCYNVYINNRLCNEEQYKAYEHELKHIKKGHLYAERLSAVFCEKEVADETL